MYEPKSMNHYLSKSLMGFEQYLWPIALFFVPVKGVLITVGAFIILDTISGLWKSRVLRVPITSKGLSAIVSKMFLYQITVLTTYLLDHYILGEILMNIFSIENLLTKMVALILVYIEAQSINENYKAAKGIDLWAKFKSLLSRAKEVTKEVTSLDDDVDKLEG